MSLLAKASLSSDELARAMCLNSVQILRMMDSTTRDGLVRYDSEEKVCLLMPKKTGSTGNPAR
jgi:hypothetical protein